MGSARYFGLERKAYGCDTDAQYGRTLTQPYCAVRAAVPYCTHSCTIIVVDTVTPYNAVLRVSSLTCGQKCGSERARDRYPESVSGARSRSCAGLQLAAAAAAAAVLACIKAHHYKTLWPGSLHVRLCGDAAVLL